MNEVPDLSVVVVFPQSTTQVSDLLWSILREDGLAIEVVVVVDERNRSDAATTSRAIANADHRVRVIDFDGAAGRTAALAAAIDVNSAPWVTVADANGLAIRGGYRDLVAGLQTSGSDLAVGTAESIAKHRYRIDRAIDGALDSEAQGVRIEDRPGLITDDLLCTKVVRRSLLQSIVRADDPWLEELLVARLHLTADRIDVRPRSIVFCRDRLTENAAARMSPEWVAVQTKIWAALAEAPSSVRESYARELIRRDVLSGRALELLAGGEDRRDAGDLILDWTRALTSISLSNLTIWARWQLALITLGHSTLVDVARPDGRVMHADDVPNFDSTRLLAEAWVALGLGADDVREGFIERFVSRPGAVRGESNRGSDRIDISIVIPTYNVVSYIDELLESIRAAVGVSIEIIVVDDGSTDGTQDRIRTHQEADDRIRLVRSPGAGGGQARDVGIELARGEYLAFADGDDLIPPRAYAHLLSIARKTGADVIIGSYLKFFTTRTWDAGTGFNQAYALPVEGVTIDTHPQLARHRAVWNRLVRREHWLETAFPFPGVPRSNDIVAMLSVLLSAQSIAVSPLPVYVYRDRPGAGSMTSAAGSADYTVSYFSEEASCAALVQQRDSAPVTREYWSMVFNADAWQNIVRYIDRRSGEGAEDHRVAAQIAKLLSRAPHSEFRRLKAEHQAAWALAAAGRFDDARTMLRAEKSASDIRMWPLVRAIAAAKAQPVMPRASIDSLALKYLMRRFISDPSWQTDAFASALPLLRSSLDDPIAPLAVVPNTLEERLARAIREGGSDAALRAIDSSSSIRTAKFHNGTRAILSGSAEGFQTGGIARLVARRESDRSRVRVAISHVTIDGDTWSAEIEPAQFPKAVVWVMELEFEDSLGMRRSRLKIDEVVTGAMPERIRRLSAAGAGGNQSLVQVRESIVTRARRKMSSLVRRSR